jgi:hypothetical protein
VASTSSLRQGGTCLGMGQACCLQVGGCVLLAAVVPLETQFVLADGCTLCMALSGS